MGHQGELFLYESERNRPGEKLLYFLGSEWSEDIQDFNDWCLRTGFGYLSTYNNTLVSETVNGSYTFETINEENSYDDPLRSN